jgi:hypothetical protein
MSFSLVAFVFLFSAAHFPPLIDQSVEALSHIISGLFVLLEPGFYFLPTLRFKHVPGPTIKAVVAAVGVLCLPDDRGGLGKP